MPDNIQTVICSVYPITLKYEIDYNRGVPILEIVFTIYKVWLVWFGITPVFSFDAGVIL